MPVRLRARPASPRSPPPAAARPPSRCRSPPPAATSSSTSSSASRCTVGRSRSTVRGVNAFETSRRSRVWSGGSRSSMPVADRACQNGACSAGRRGPAEVLVRAHVQIGPPQPPVPQQRVDVRVPGDEPLPGRLEPRHRLVLAQRGVRRVRVRHERRGPGVEAVRHPRTVTAPAPSPVSPIHSRPGPPHPTSIKDEWPPDQGQITLHLSLIDAGKGADMTVVHPRKRLRVELPARELTLEHVTELAAADDIHRYELIDGTLLVMPPADVDHARVISALHGLVRQPRLRRRSRPAHGRPSRPRPLRRAQPGPARAAPPGRRHDGVGGRRGHAARDRGRLHRLGLRGPDAQAHRVRQCGRPALLADRAFRRGRHRSRVRAGSQTSGESPPMSVTRRPCSTTCWRTNHRRCPEFDRVGQYDIERARGARARADARARAPAGARASGSVTRDGPYQVRWRPETRAQGVPGRPPGRRHG